MKEYPVKNTAHDKLVGCGWRWWKEKSRRGIGKARITEGGSDQVERREGHCVSCVTGEKHIRIRLEQRTG